MEDSSNEFGKKIATLQAKLKESRGEMINLKNLIPVD